MKLKNNILAIAAAITFCGCTSVKSAGEAVDLNGEWNIVEVGGTAIDTTKTEFNPTLGFETAKNSVFGCAGCNSINGIARVNAAKQTISFKEIGWTLMLCAIWSMSSRYSRLSKASRRIRRQARVVYN